MDANILKAENELDVYRKALDAAAYVLETDKDGIITYVNDKYCELMKYTREELIGQNNHIFNSEYHPEEFYQDLWSTIKSGKIHRAEIRNKAKDGSLVWLDATIIPFLDYSGKPYKYLTIRYNITTKINAMKTREQFLANISHDIKTPLHSIINFTEFMLETKLNETQSGYMDSIRNSSEILYGLIKDLLDIYKIESGKISFTKADFSLHGIVKSMEDIFAARLKEKNLRMSFHFSADTPENIKGDEFRLKQVLMNLISNSIQYTESGGVNVKVNVINKIKNQINIQFDVSDSGAGIPQEMLPVIFNRFSQVGANKAGTSGHVGLGLSIVKQVVELQGGMLDIESTVGVGTTVIFEIPFEKASSNIIKNSAKNEIPIFTGKRILIADDSVMNRAILQKYLTDAGIISETAENGAEVLTKLKCAHFDLLLLDLQMPIMDGFETLKIIRSEKKEKWKKIPVITVSARYVGEEKQQIIEAGATDVLAKPFKADELFAVLVKYMKPTEIIIKENIDPTKTTNDIERISDLCMLASHTENNKELMQEMVTYFLTNTPTNITEIYNSLIQNDWKTARRIIHTMANQVNYMGIEKAYKKLDIAELIAKEETAKDSLLAIINDIEKILNIAYIELQGELKRLTYENSGL